MPALAANSMVAGTCCMDFSSHITNLNATPKVRTRHADLCAFISHNQNMARRGIPKGQVNWYLKEWMASVGLKGRGAQSKMMELTGWSKATMSQLFNGEQDYSPKIVNEASVALNAKPWELLMHPEEAMALRQFRKDAVRLAAVSEDIDRTGTEG